MGWGRPRERRRDLGLCGDNPSLKFEFCPQLRGAGLGCAMGHECPEASLSRRFGHGTAKLVVVAVVAPLLPLVVGLASRGVLRIA